MDRGKAICQELKREGIRYVAWLCDSETHFMHEPIQSDPEIRSIKVCHEGEALGICLGLSMGRARGAVLMSNQGMFQAGNILKSVIDTEAPLVMLVSNGLSHHKRSPVVRRRTAKNDFTVPFLDAFGVKHYLVDTDEDVARVGLACREANELRRPVALLLSSADFYEPGT